MPRTSLSEEGKYTNAVDRVKEFDNVYGGIDKLRNEHRRHSQFVSTKEKASQHLSPFIERSKSYKKYMFLMSVVNKFEGSNTVVLHKIHFQKSTKQLLLMVVKV